jgi:hypothetical protein
MRVDLRSGARELIALRVNPFLFGRDPYSPAKAEDGRPFTIGRLIHTGRNFGDSGYTGGAAVFRTLSAPEMKKLAEVGRRGILRAMQ